MLCYIYVVLTLLHVCMSTCTSTSTSARKYIHHFEGKCLNTSYYQLTSTFFVMHPDK